MAVFTLGLDIGSNSIGWALLDTENQSIIDTGVRVFPEGVDRDTKGAELSKNESRRIARGSRRMRFRRTIRKNRLLKLLRSKGLLPENNDELDKLMMLTDPYQLRSKGLDEKISLHEFGRVLFHINQRRGFWSNRKTAKSKETGVVYKSVNELQQNIEENNCRTLGEYFAKIDSHEERIRGHYTFRSMYEHEFDLLWEKQSEYYPEILTEEFKPKIKEETIFFQRPLKPTDDLIGDCTLEEGQKRCPRADWYARRFRILQDLNNLIIRNSDGTESALTREQRIFVLDELSKKKDVKFDRLRKQLNLIESQTFNLEDDGQEKKLNGDEFAHQMRAKKILGPKAWDSLDIADQISINEAIIDDDIEDDRLVSMLIEQHNFTKEQAKTALDVTLPQKYMSFSRLAIQKLLPHMEKGAKTHEAMKAVYGEKVFQQASGDLNLLDQPEDIRNPVVMKALFELRKVVNAIIRQYGKPTRVAVEMARDIQGSSKQREERTKKMRENERINDNARKELIDNVGISNPSRNDTIKYKLWDECNHVCPYTGKSISQHSLFGPNPEFQVEHIIPYSRCLDDSYMNKTLCYVRENIDKGEKTPYEFYSGTPEKYEAVLQRIESLPYPKRKRFTQQEVELDDFIQRQLNDTRYITKMVVAYLKRLGVIVKGTRGMATAELRHCWGLNNILDYTGAGLKNRDDHRHHAVDAAVTALTTNQHLKELAQCKYAKESYEFPLPWDAFRQQLTDKINSINVSHRVTRKVSGPLHEETNYGPTGLKDDKSQDIFVYRKPLEALTLPMIDKIVDPVVKQIVRHRLTEFGIDSDKKGSMSKDVWEEPLYMKSRNVKGPQIKKVRIKDVFNNMIMIKDDEGKFYRAVAPGNNHHIEIFEYTDKKGQLKRDAKVVTLYEAVQRSIKGKPVICRDHGNGKKFICSLAKNEMVMLEAEDGNNIPHRVQKLTQSGKNISIILRPHTYAGKVSDTDSPPIIQRKSPNTLNGYKIVVDPLGRIHPAND